MDSAEHSRQNEHNVDNQRHQFDINAVVSAQISCYKMLARNEPIPTNLLHQATKIPKQNDLLPNPYEYPLDLENGSVLPYDLSKILTLHQQKSTNRTTSLPLPPGINPQTILQERENRC